MISYEAIKSLEGMNDKAVKELRQLAKEAKEAEQLIKSTWIFVDGESIITVLEDVKSGNIIEELTNEGVWTRREGKGYYEIPCVANQIFEYFNAEYVYKKDPPCAKENEMLVRMAKYCAYFREFLKRTEEKHASMQ